MKDKFKIEDFTNLKKWAIGMTIASLLLTISQGIYTHIRWNEMIAESSTEYINGIEIQPTLEFYSSYMLGGTAIGLTLVVVCIILWIIYATLESNNNSLIKKNLSYKIKTIMDNESYGNDFQKKMKSLENLRDSQVIKESDFEKRKSNLIWKFESKIDSENEDKRLEGKLKALKNALNEGLVSKEEYNTKVNFYSDAKINESPKVKFDKSKCPACGNKLSKNDEVCNDCGLRVS